MKKALILVLTLIGCSNAFSQTCMVTAPWSEDFESADWAFLGSVHPGNIDTCFTRNSKTFFWGVSPNINPYTGPAADHTTGSGKYIFTKNASSYVLFDTAEISTPVIDLSPLTVPELTFWYHMYGADIGNLEVLVSNDGGGSFATLFSISGAQQGHKVSPWKEKIINLAPYANDSIILKFRGQKLFPNRDSDVAIDDIDIHERPACPKPIEFHSTSFRDAFVLEWTSGGASDWQVEYGPPGFVSGTGNRISVTSDSIRFSGFPFSTSYDFYVRDSCSATEVSDWQGPLRDTTLCDVYPAPFHENFEGSQWPLASFFPHPKAGMIDECWQRSDTNIYFWKPAHVTLYAYTGPDHDHTTGIGKFMYALYNGPIVPTTDLTTPSIDCSSLLAPELRFWYHMYGVGTGKLEVLVSDGTTWTAQDSIMGDQQISPSDAWQERVIDLSAYAGDTVQVRFRGSNAFNHASNIAIDDIWLGEVTTCPSPSNISVLSTGRDSVVLDWTSGGASEWLIGYRRAGSTDSLTILSASTKSFSVNGLEPGTLYNFYVRDSCAPADVSLWAGPVLFHTECATETAPWSENFDGNQWQQGVGLYNAGNRIDPCWSPVGGSFGPSSGPTIYQDTGPSSDVSGTGRYLFVIQGGGLINSPSIYIPEELLSPHLKFSYHMYGAHINRLMFYIDSGAGYTKFTEIIGEQHTSSNDPWITDSFNISGYSDDTIQIRFYGYGSAGGLSHIAIDEVAITGRFCPDPTALSFSNITGTSLDLGWTSNSGMSDVEVVPLGQPPGSGNPHTNVSSPLSISGLSYGTSYLVYVRDSCGDGIFSGWVSDTVTTSPCPLPTANFSFTTNFLGASFTSTSNGDSLYWDFGDGSDTSGISAPFHTYSAPGTYAVSIIAFNHCGTADTLTDTLLVCDIPNAVFSLTNIGNTVYLDASASTAASFYYWDLGNGTDTAGQQISYVYSDTSTHVITLTIVSDCGDSASFSRTFKGCTPPIASWTSNVTGTGGSGMQVYFDASTSQSAVTFEWDFGDGNDTSGISLSHTYSAPGTYAVSLIVFNRCGASDTLTDTIVVCEVPNAVFSLTNFGDTVYLDASASTTASFYYWDLGNGTDTTGQQISYVYSDTSTHVVTLIIVNDCGDSATFSRTFKLCNPPTASWTYNILGTGGTGMQVQFDASASQNAITFDWDFGDGNKATGTAQPVHIYSTPSLSYKVELTVTNDCGDKNSLSYKLSEISIEELNLMRSIELFPNPADDEIELQWPGQDFSVHKIEILDISGRKILERKITHGQSGNQKLDVSALSAGYFILRVYTDKGVGDRQVIVR